MRRYQGTAAGELTLLPAQGDIVFAIKKGKGYVPLAYSQWNYRVIVLSREAASQVKGEVNFAMSLGDFHSPWVALKGDLHETRFYISTGNQLLEAVYTNQGSVSKTLNLVGGPLTVRPRRIFGGLRKVLISTLVLSLLGLLVSFGVYQSQYRSLVLENKVQTLELQKQLAREKIRIAGHEKQIEALEKETPILAKQYEIALARQEVLQKGSDQGYVKGDALYLAQLQSHTLLLQLKEKGRELTRLNSELLAWNQLLAEQKVLQEQTEALTRSSYWKWLQGQFQ